MGTVFFFHVAARQLDSSCEAANNKVFEYVKSNHLNVSRDLLPPILNMCLNHFVWYFLIGIKPSLSGKIMSLPW